ncbi:hypothetical protein SARC_07338 [Sphaeroforma arctica JP610]|uniref:Choline/carnitine acyltransferase domain-containing protein n=1 Tax=Sphaeroforma arctica JP610 TaxID=667725 RepID=A0A0L0FWH1_9EUKA|nr:hypothetical protein SARC_07338 [Sphaeroforma arctica JP610]KNC80303.1 hypothetical protein SARC_07338 [Sphaeroforma arctica JP610]|eukprot:XP_014154205.1 hypothetical protein SARC_07338 [Sphaeroforma arctica JP610]
MAEAHNVSLAFQDTHLHGVEEDFELVHIRQENFQVSYNHHGVVLFIPNPRSIGRRIAKKVYQFRNHVVSSLYPLPIQLVYVVSIAYIGFMLDADREGWWRNNAIADFVWAVDSKMNLLSSHLPIAVRVAYQSAIVGVLVIMIFMYIHRLLLKVLLSYQGWMDAPKSKMTLAWGAMLKIFYLGGGRQPNTYSFNVAMPTMPIPSAKDTVARYLKSVEVCLSPSKYQYIKELADEFLASSELTKMQGLLHVKKLMTSNYVSDWWLKYVYLRGRSSLLINSNYYGLGFASHLPSKKQTSRAGFLTHELIVLKTMLDREQLEPLLIQKLVPLCMNQYQFMFSATRVPHREADEIRQYDSGESRHVVVNYKGLMYKMEVFDKQTGEVSTPHHLERSLEYIVQHADHRLASENFSEADLSIPALTGANRTVWAEARDKHFSAGVNRASLNLVENSIFTLCLDDHEPQTWTEQGKNLLHGDGTGLWADKSFNLVVFRNGIAGINGEHSWGDAPVAAHMWETVSGREIKSDPYDRKTGCLKPSTAEEDKDLVSTDSLATLLTKNLDAEAKKGSVVSGKARVPTAVNFRMNPDLEKTILECKAEIIAAGEDLELNVFSFDKFGKDRIKKVKCSPDGFIQMAFQLAYYREAKIHPLTYESSMTRMFKDGRTETIRSCTSKAAAFVKACEDPKVSKAETLELLRDACRNHSEISKEAMKGEGVDRHLFALYVVAMGLGAESKFLSEALNMKWKLSTSQLPQRQGDPADWGGKHVQQDDKYFSPSGGFGPVDDSGYGVSYNIAGEKTIFFHVASKKSCPETDSVKFSENIQKALQDMADLLED